MSENATREAAPTGRKVQRQTMSGQVADDLRRRILSGELPEGTQLKQEQLALEFGISKVPVREALHQLEAEGFVVQQFHRGAVVAGLSPSQAMELFEIRAELETWLLGIAMPLASEATAAAAESILAETAGTQDPALWPDLNWRFHEVLYRPAGKDYSLDLVRKLHGQLDRYVRLQYALVNSRDEAMLEHRKLLQLYVARDRQAKDALRRHIMKAASDLEARLAAAGLSAGR